MNQKTQELIAEFGDQAYHVAAEFTVIAVHVGDTVGAEMFAEMPVNFCKPVITSIRRRMTYLKRPRQGWRLVLRHGPGVPSLDGLDPESKGR